MYTAADIAALFPEGTHQLAEPSSPVRHICIDSRRAAWMTDAIFIALSGARKDGHEFIQHAWEQGIRTFLIDEKLSQPALPGCNWIRVPNVLAAFHDMAKAHRKRYHGQLVAITGSNGKTWVKEWLYMLLFSGKPVYRSPGSYNSQVGVPLSAWNIPLNSEIAILEAGISAPDEMARLESILHPDIVIFTHLGDAHDEGFNGDSQFKLNEKLRLCGQARTIVFPEDETVLAAAIRDQFGDRKLISWGEHPSATIVTRSEREGQGTRVYFETGNQQGEYVIPFSGSIPVANSLSCLGGLVALGLDTADFVSGFEDLVPIDMRLRAEDGIQGCVIINDSYSLDLDSLQYALESLDIAGPSQKKTIILSDHAFGRQGMIDEAAKMITGAGVDKLICIGEEIQSISKNLDPNIRTSFFANTDEFLRKELLADFQREVILLKGARRFGFEKIARALRARSHSAVLHVDFGALDHNLRYFYKRIQPGVKKIAVVKANAYGAGSREICRFLSYQHIDMLAVALIDEGIELRDGGIQLPVMVLNPDPDGMELILQYHLEPEIYNTQILASLIRECSFRQEPVRIHIKLDSGTHRLGFVDSDLGQLIRALKDHPLIQVGSVFTHLSASDDPTWDDFTHEQARRFSSMYETLCTGLGYRPPRHILSTFGILRFPEYQFEYVRLGIGLYGVGLAERSELLPVHHLKAKVLHVQEIEPGESVSYARSFITDRKRRIATVNIGYADGLPRSAGDKGYSLSIRGKKAPITGRVCMDMTMIDVSDIPEVRVGDEVVVFGKGHPIDDLAALCGTIPYEILTHLHERIRKVYEHGS